MRRLFSQIPIGRCTTFFSVLLCLGFTAPVSASEESTATDASTQTQQGKVVVVPYKTRPAPSHQITLRDDRVYFLKNLEQNDGLYVLHTLEGEVIEVGASDIAEIVEFKAK